MFWLRADPTRSSCLSLSIRHERTDCLSVLGLRDMIVDGNSSSFSPFPSGLLRDSVGLGRGAAVAAACTAVGRAQLPPDLGE